MAKRIHFPQQVMENLIDQRRAGVTLRKMSQDSGYTIGALEGLFKRLGLTRKKDFTLHLGRHWDRDEMHRMTLKGMSLQEISKELNLSVNAVAVRLTTLRDEGYKVPYVVERKNLKIKHQLYENQTQVYQN